MVNVITLNNLCSLREDKKVGILFFAISQKKGNIVWLKLTLGTSCFRLKYRHQRVTYFKSKLYVKTFLNYALCFWRYFFSLKELKSDIWYVLTILECQKTEICLEIFFSRCTFLTYSKFDFISLFLSLIRGTLNLKDSIIKFHVCVVIWAI
jgi:hypothetical protein